MAKYEVLDKVWLDRGRGPELIKAGELVYDGWPNAQLKPLDAEAKANVKLLEEARQRHGSRLPATPADYREQEKARIAAEKAAAKQGKGKPEGEQQKAA